MKKILITLFLIIAIVITICQCEDGTQKQIETQREAIIPFKSKEECYKAHEEYKEKCLRNNKSEFKHIHCVAETYCDPRGCC